MRLHRLLDLYKKPRTNGIFFSMSKNTTLNSIFSKLGYSQDSDYHSMDFEYLYNHSGLKTASVMVEQLLDGYIIDNSDDYVVLSNGEKVSWDYIMTKVDEDIINFIIVQRFSDKWDKLVETIKIQFDTLSPYSMSYERETNDKLSSKNYNTRYNNTSNDISDKSDREGSINDSAYGFNSISSVPTDDSKDKSSVERVVTDNTEFSGKDDTEYDRNNELKTTIKRKGNIGNKSSQQLIEEQRKMLEWQLYDVIFNDLDSVLTRSKYIL